MSAPFLLQEALVEIVHSETSGNIAETTAVDSDGTVVVRRSQDNQKLLDAIGRANFNGTAEIPGLGRLVAEVPPVMLMDYCRIRGIPWEDVAYRGLYDKEFTAFLKANPKLVYEYRRKYL